MDSSKFRTCLIPFALAAVALALSRSACAQSWGPTVGGGRNPDDLNGDRFDRGPFSDDPMWSCGGSGPTGTEEAGVSPTTRNPVDLTDGHKLEYAIDLRIPMVGRPFTLWREYTSRTDAWDGYGRGSGWTGDIARFLWVSLEGGGAATLEVGGMAKSAIASRWSSGFVPAEENRLEGGTLQTVTKANLTVASGGADDGEYPVWRLTEPGRWQIDFVRARDHGGMGDEEAGPGQPEIPAKLVGNILQKRDAYGNRQEYHYTLHTLADSKSIWSLDDVKCYAVDGQPQARIHFDWDDVGGGSTARLLKVKVYRPYLRGELGDPDELQTHEVTYTYHDGDGKAWLGSAGDLIQVEVDERVDPAPGAGDPNEIVWRPRFTQYRYHNYAEDVETGDDGDSFDDETGDQHQLKMVINAEQIEFYAQAHASSVTAPMVELTCDLGSDVAAYAAHLLELDDGELDECAHLSPANLAAKMIPYYDVHGRVATQVLLTGCGCASAGTQGMREDFTYSQDESPTYDGGMTVVTVESYRDESEWVPYRKRYADLVRFGEAPVTVPDNRGFYLVNQAMTGPGEGHPFYGKYWVTHFERSDDGSLVLRMYTPSATAGYAPYSGEEAPEYTAKSDDGLVYAYKYDELGRRTEIRLHKGKPSADELGSSDINYYWLVETVAYSDDPGEEYLVEEIRRVRTEEQTSMPSEDDVELTTFENHVHESAGSNHALAWVKRTVEAELPEENGPTGDLTYSSWEIFDPRGLNVWSVAADGTRTKRVFDNDEAYPASVSRTGQVVKVIRNADDFSDERPVHNVPTDENLWMPDDLPADRNAEDDGDEGADDGTLSLTTTVTRDILGRVQATASPGGVAHAVTREMRESPDRAGILYYAEVSLPFEYDTDTFDGSATVTWFNAGDKPFATQGKLVTALDSGEQDAQYRRVYDGYTLDAIVARSYTEHRVSGLAQAVQQWHRFTPSEAYYESTFEYDALGRLQSTVDGDGTIQSFTYDIKDRVKTVSTSVGEHDPTLVEERFYDSAYDEGEAEEIEGTGEGTLTLVRRPVSSTALEDRYTRVVYDFRDRAVSTLNAAAPHQAVSYDNLNRPVLAATLDGSTATTNFGSTDTHRVSLTRTSYSQRGLAWKGEMAIDPTAAVGSASYLASSSWFDEVGRTVGSQSPSSPGNKATYDGLGRTTASYTTDNGGFGSYAAVHASHASVLSSDKVIEQRETQYVVDANAAKGLPDLVTTRLRTHVDTGTGSLSGATAVVTFLGMLYDDAARPIHTIDFGTRESSFSTGGSAPSIVQGSSPTPLTSWILSSTAYDARGLVETTTDSGGSATKSLYDGLGRRFATIENYDDATVAWNTDLGRWRATDVGTTDGTDRVVSTVYDASGHVVLYVAHQHDDSDPGDRDQVTAYSYGVSPADTEPSALWSNGLLLSVTYLDEGVVTYAYNAQGELVHMEDQNGTEHVYTRDPLGRVTRDDATQFGTNIDQTIVAIERKYDEAGRLEHVTSWGDGPAVLNQVWFGYTPLGQIEKVWQHSTGAVNTTGEPPVPDDPPSGDTRLVTYVYSNSAAGSGNYSRVTEMDYPRNTNGGGAHAVAALEYVYGSGINSSISRVSRLDFDGAETVNYSYLGQGIFVEVDYHEIDVQLDRTASGEGKRHTQCHTSQDAGVYPGLDRFGRVKRQDWLDGCFTTHETSEVLPDRPQIVSLGYEYDAGGNRTRVVDLRPGSQWKHSFEYSYDGLHRLTEADRGKWSGSAVTSVKGAQQWTLDLLGNWSVFKSDADYSGSYQDYEQQNREHNLVNELVQSVTPTLVPVDEDFTYDAAGNMRTRIGGGLSELNDSFRYTHDAWNRLVRIEGGESWELEVLEQQFNGLNWRTWKHSDTPTPAVFDFDFEYFIPGVLDGALDETYVYTYDASWRLLDERITATLEGVDSRTVQHVWGNRYIDDCVLHRRDVDGDGDYSEIADGDGTFYHLTDAMFSTVAVMEDHDVIERVTYDPYGMPLHHWGADLNGDGAITAVGNTLAGNDARAITNTSSTYGPHYWESAIVDADYSAIGDVNRDGLIDAEDLGALAPVSGPPQFPRWLSACDGVAGLDGYIYDPELAMYMVRNRTYEPALGRWLERDPLGSREGSNLLEYSAGRPGTFTDPLGTAAGPASKGPCKTDIEDHSCMEDCKKTGYPAFTDPPEAPTGLPKRCCICTRMFYEHDPITWTPLFHSGKDFGGYLIWEAAVREKIRCATVHEEVHMGQCGGTHNCQECEAHHAELLCLEAALARCGNNKDCSSLINTRIIPLRHYTKQWCAACEMDSDTNGGETPWPGYPGERNWEKNPWQP